MEPIRKALLRVLLCAVKSAAAAPAHDLLPPVHMHTRDTLDTRTATTVAIPSCNDDGGLASLQHVPPFNGLCVQGQQLEQPVCHVVTLPAALVRCHHRACQAGPYSHHRLGLRQLMLLQLGVAGGRSGSIQQLAIL